MAADCVQRAVERLACSGEATALPDGLALFLKHYLRDFSSGIGTGWSFNPRILPSVLAMIVL